MPTKNNNQIHNFILGTKQKMSQIFIDDGRALPVTVIEAGPCRVVQVKKQDDDKITAVQIGFGRKNKLSKPQAGHLKNLDNFKYLKDFTVSSVNDEKLVQGQKIAVDTFSPGERVKVVAISKGKGFQGVVKRHGFHGSPASHGHKDQLRMPGSIGATDAARVFKGTRMGGRMGGKQVTVDNLEVVKVDLENNLLYLRGAIPGRRGALVKILGNGELKFAEEKIQKAPAKQENEKKTKEKETAELKENENKEDKEIPKEQVNQEVSKKNESEKNKKQEGEG